MDTAIPQHQITNTACTRCEQLDLECIKPGRITKKLLLKVSAKHLAHSNCLRRQIMLTLLFTALPLCGICITDLTFILIDPFYAIPVPHVAICAFLLLVIISSYIILMVHATPRSATSRYMLTGPENKAAN